MINELYMDKVKPLNQRKDEYIESFFKVLAYKHFGGLSGLAKQDCVLKIYGSDGREEYFINGKLVLTACFVVSQFSIRWDFKGVEYE